MVGCFDRKVDERLDAARDMRWAGFSGGTAVKATPTTMTNRHANRPTRRPKAPNSMSVLPQSADVVRSGPLSIPLQIELDPVTSHERPALTALDCLLLCYGV